MGVRLLFETLNLLLLAGDNILVLIHLFENTGQIVFESLDFLVVLCEKLVYLGHKPLYIPLNTDENISQLLHRFSLYSVLLDF